MKTKSGFTIVELMITVVIIALLSGVSMFAYVAVQRDARDSTRKGVVLVISEALEKYYEANGEYPSIASLKNSDAANTGAAVAAKLKIRAADILMPNMPAGATNSITSDLTPPDSYISYSTDETVYTTLPELSYLATCKTDVNGGCLNFILKYKNEAGSIIPITSQHVE